MWKKIIFLFFFFPGVHSYGHSQHLSELNEAFPYGLLTNDFEVLTKEDLNINACVATAKAFSEDSHSYPYWQCFESRTSQLNCEGRKYDPYEKSRMTLFVVSAKLNGDLHEYLYRRAIPLRECHLFQKEWRRLLKDQKYVCVSGPFNSVKKNKNGRTWSWVFDRYKNGIYRV